jgi:tRNA-specific 2-thiouridylase
MAQIRAHHRAVPATVEALPDGEAEIRFETPQPAITPGQVVTVYQADLVLGGGWIERAIN